MSQCPVCQTEYTKSEVNRCSVCDWDLTPCPEAFLDKQNIQVSWAKNMWVKFHALQEQSPTQIIADIDANPQLSKLKEESNSEAWHQLLNWIFAVDLYAAKTSVEKICENYKDKQPREIAHLLIVQKSFQAAGLDLLRGISGAAIISGLSGVDLPTITKLAAEMVYQIAAIYGLDLQALERKIEVLTVLGMVCLGEKAIEAGINWLKFGTGPSQVISAGAKALMIYSIGKAACLFYELKVNQDVNPLNSPEVFYELRQESQDYLKNATSEKAIVEIVSVEIETTPVRLPLPKPVKKNNNISVQSRVSGGATSLRGYFTLPNLIAQGMQRRLGRGEIKNLIPLDNELFVVCATGGTALLNRISGEVLWEIDCPATCGAISFDGTLLALGWRSNIYLWDLSKGRLLKQLQGRELITRLALSADGKLLASSDGDNTVQLWNVVSGRELRKFVQSSHVYSVTLSPNGKLLALGEGYQDPVVRLWDTGSGRELQQLQGHTSSVDSIIISPDGKLLASTDGYDTVRLWDISSSQEVQKLCIHEDEHLGGGFTVAFTPDSKLLVWEKMHNTVQMWDIAGNKQQWQLQGYTNSVKQVVFSPDGLLVGAVEYQTIWLWDVATGKVVRQLVDTSEINCIAFSPDGKLIASGTENDTIWLWDIANGTKLRRLKGDEEGLIQSVVFSPDGRLLASKKSYRTVQLWDVVTGREQKKERVSHINELLSIAISPNGKLLALGINYNTWLLWEFPSCIERSEISAYRRRYEYVKSVAFSPNGKLLATGSDDKTVRLWNVATGREQQKFTHPYGVYSVTFSFNGELLASASYYTVCVWNVFSGTERLQLQGHESSVWSVAFNPHSNLLASGGSDGVVRLWKV